MTEPFDIIFVDLEFFAYLPTVKQVLNRHLLAGCTVCLGFFARAYKAAAAYGYVLIRQAFGVEGGCAVAVQTPHRAVEHDSGLQPMVPCQTN